MQWQCDVFSLLLCMYVVNFYDENGYPLSVKSFVEGPYCAELLELGYGSFCHFLGYLKEEGVLKVSQIRR